MGAYLANAFAPLADALHPLQRLSPCTGPPATTPLVHGTGTGLLILLAVTGILVALAAFRFTHRDLAS